MWVGHGSGRDREQTWVVEESVERKRIRGFDDRVSACFHGEQKDFSCGIIGALLAEACAGVARSIDRGYVLLQTGTRVLERKLMRENLN